MAADLPDVRLESDLFTGPLVELWGVLFDLAEQVLDAWSLIGGQMVLLHGLEHGRTPPAASADLDVLADVQSDQQSLRRLVAALERLGFSPAGMSPQGNLLHRYRRGVEPQRLVVDLLAPDNLGPRADLTRRRPAARWRGRAVGRLRREPRPWVCNWGRGRAVSDAPACWGRSWQRLQR